MTKNAEKIIEWDIGTAYDFFISLWALHEPENLGLRGSWAAGVRSRIPTPERETLQRITNIVWPMAWVHSLPAPKDVATALETMRAIPPAERLSKLLPPNLPEPIADLRAKVEARGSWSEADQKLLYDELVRDDWKKHPAAEVRQAAADFLEMWIDPVTTGETMLAAYEAYQEVFFAEEEARIRPALEAALERGQEQARSIPQWEQLLEVLSQGVRVAKDWDNKTLILVPSYWGTPLALMAQLDEERMLFLFGARPADESLIPGEVVPDALYQALKALADPTRLRILRYLTDEPLTPAELARRLRLRPPTVLHHLDALRLARLVIVTLDHEGKRYAVRPDAVAAMCGLLNRFLAGREE